MSKATAQEQHWRDMEFLDQLLAVACMLRPYCERNTAEPFTAIVTTDARPWTNNADLTDDGWRFLERVIGAIDSAVGAREKMQLREYPRKRWTCWSRPGGRCTRFWSAGSSAITRTRLTISCPRTWWRSSHASRIGRGMSR